MKWDLSKTIHIPIPDQELQISFEKVSTDLLFPSTEKGIPPPVLFKALVCIHVAEELEFERIDCKRGEPLLCEQFEGGRYTPTCNL